jgi:hypothetical protein
MAGSSDQDIIFWQYALNASWVLLPLVPSILIYLIFPKTETALKGPFSGLTVRASGAFAAYFIVLLATIPLLLRQNNNLEGLLHPTWTITGSIQLEDEDGNRLKFNNRGESPFKIDLDPRLVYPIGTDGFKVKVPEREDNSVPTLLITYPDFASYTLDPNNPDAGDNVKIDNSKKLIEVTSPIVLRRQKCVGLTCDQPL